MNKYRQQPSEVVDYLIDLTVWIPENDSVIDTVARVTHSTHLDPSVPIEMRVWVTDKATRKPKIWCADGTNNIEYKITVLVTTAAGRVKEVDYKILVREQ